ncbi:DUF305 domain-containing protein [Pedobacter agri]|uniref:DUF305 domain-containing protein n=1 Tax=Pedobacter agri TaxID=454586 RepID=UPI002930566F|nr:DUF305 domain-containing protein [Pedobacter agri]
MKTNSYKTFGLMLTLSFFIMYGVMFLNLDDSSHIYLSITRTYMTLLMIAPMAVLMLLLMPMMYKNKGLNRIINISAVAIFALSFWMRRSQVVVTDAQYMRAMIPHHSSAIMTSRHADLKDPELKELSISIISSQEKEIKQMKAILERLHAERGGRDKK